MSVREIPLKKLGVQLCHFLLTKHAHNQQKKLDVVAALLRQLNESGGKLFLPLRPPRGGANKSAIANEQEEDDPQDATAI